MAVRLESWSETPDGERYCFSSSDDEKWAFDAKHLLGINPQNKRVMTAPGVIEDTVPTYIGFDRELRERVYVWLKFIDITPRQPDLFAKAGG